MKRSILSAALILMAASPAWAETIHVGVNGMVCAFCAAGIEASFKDEATVKTVKVDMDKSLVTLTSEEPAAISDAAITAVITDAGYTVTSIHRQE